MPSSRDLPLIIESRFAVLHAPALVVSLDVAGGYARAGGRDVLILEEGRQVVVFVTVAASGSG